MRKPSELLIGWALSVGFSACASAPPPAPAGPLTPAPVVAAAPEPPPAPEPATSNEATPLASAEPASPPTPPAEELSAVSKPSRPPLDILTSADTAFLINYSASSPVEAARRSCADKSAGDPEAQAKCLSEAREAFKADVIRFRKVGSHWGWTVYKRAGSRLDEVSSGRVELSEASPNSVKVKLISDKGLRPVLKNKREAIITVPNDYSFEINDADWGRLQYEAKIGLVAN